MRNVTSQEMEFKILELWNLYLEQQMADSKHFWNLKIWWRDNDGDKLVYHQK